MPAAKTKPAHIYSYGSVPNSSAPDVSASATKGRKRKKRGRPKKRAWSLRSEFLRRHSPKYLRRTEVYNLMQADAFAMRIGRPLRTFVSIRWALTEEGETNIQRRWTALLNAMRIWASRHNIEWTAIGVHENPERAEPAFNTHLLNNIPAKLHGEFTEWLRKQLGGDPHAVDVRPRKTAGMNSDKTLLYMMKGCDPQTARRFNIRYKNQGVVPFRRCTTTRNINARAQQAWKLSGTIKMDAGRFPNKGTKDRAA
jgi:hypothetical protein